MTAKIWKNARISKTREVFEREIEADLIRSREKINQTRVIIFVSKTKNSEHQQGSLYCHNIAYSNTDGISGSLRAA